MKPILAFAALLAVGLPARGENARHPFSAYYNIYRTSFEARYIPSERFYLAFVPSIIARGFAMKPYSDKVFPNMHMDQAYSVYGYVKALRLNPYADLAGRAGVEIQDIRNFSDFFYFAEVGLRLKFSPVENWVFDLSSYPIQYSFLTYRDQTAVDIFAYSGLNFGLEYLF
jgi:hypothetical protein